MREILGKQTKKKDNKIIYYFDQLTDIINKT